jgi:hypothetical protein
MPQYVVVQPNGKYAVFSTVVDKFVYYDADREGVAVALLEDRIEQIKRDIEAGIVRAESAGPAPFEKCITTIRNIHGEDDAEMTRAVLSANEPAPQATDNAEKSANT